MQCAHYKKSVPIHTPETLVSQDNMVLIGELFYLLEFVKISHQFDSFSSQEMQ